MLTAVPFSVLLMNAAEWNHAADKDGSGTYYTYCEDEALGPGYGFAEAMCERWPGHADEDFYGSIDKNADGIDDHYKCDSCSGVDPSDTIGLDNTTVDYWLRAYASPKDYQGIGYAYAWWSYN